MASVYCENPSPVEGNDDLEMPLRAHLRVDLARNQVPRNLARNQFAMKSTPYIYTWNPRQFESTKIFSSI